MTCDLGARIFGWKIFEENMTDEESTSCRIDVLAIGLFGLAVWALTVGMAQIGQIPEMDRARVLVIALVFGGLIQVLAGDC